MTLVEQIARASFTCWRKRMDELGHHLDKGKNFEDMNESEMEFAFMNARAILEAMRNPPDAVMVDCDDDNSGAPYCADHSYLRDQWNKMIDVALRGGK